MWYQEEVEASVLDFGLFNESFVYVCTLRGVEDLSLILHEESLSYSLIDNNQSDIGKLEAKFANIIAVLVLDQSLELVKLKINYLSSH